MSASLFLLLAALPSVYWAQPPESAEALRQAGLERVCVAREAAADWRAAGLGVVPVSEKERRDRTPLRAPGLVSRAGVASATQRPWINANGWRFVRAAGDRYWCEAPAGQASLALFEAFAYGADVMVAIDPADAESAGRTLAFLSTVTEAALPPVVDIAVQDDGSPLVGEVLNLMARRNLLFGVGRGTAGAPLKVRVGSKEFPREDAQNPEVFALALRRRLGDERRSLRLYGSEVVFARLTRDANRARLQLVNYGGRTIEGLRVRLLGSWRPGEALVFGQGRVVVEDRVADGGATEFSLPTLGPYAVIDLESVR